MAHLRKLSSAGASGASFLLAALICGAAVAEAPDAAGALPIATDTDAGHEKDPLSATGSGTCDPMGHSEYRALVPYPEPVSNALFRLRIRGTPNTSFRVDDATFILPLSGLLSMALPDRKEQPADQGTAMIEIMAFGCIEIEIVAL